MRNSIAVSLQPINGLALVEFTCGITGTGFVWLQCTANGWLPHSYESVTLGSAFPAWRNELTPADLTEDERAETADNPQYSEDWPGSDYM